MDCSKLTLEFANAYAANDTETCGHIAMLLHGFEWVCGMKVYLPDTENPQTLRHVGFKGRIQRYAINNDRSPDVTFSDGCGYPPDITDFATGCLLRGLLSPQSKGDIVMRSRNTATVHLIPVPAVLADVLPFGVAVVMVALYNAGFTQQSPPGVSRAGIGLVRRP